MMVIITHARTPSDARTHRHEDTLQRPHRAARRISVFLCEDGRTAHEATRRGSASPVVRAGSCCERTLGGGLMEVAAQPDRVSQHTRWETGMNPGPRERKVTDAFRSRTRISSAADGRTDVGQRTTSHLGRDARTRVRNFKTDVSCCVGIVLRTGLVCVWRIMSNEDERRMTRNVDVDVDVNVNVNGTGTRYVQMRVRAGRTIIRRVRGVGR